MTTTEGAGRAKKSTRAAQAARKRATKVRGVKGVQKAIEGTTGPLLGELAPKTRGRPQKHPWHLIRVEYIEGIPNAEGSVDYPTFEALAKKWGLTKSQVGTKAADEHWTKRKEMAQAAAAADRRRDRLKEMAGYSADIDEKSIKVSQLGLGLVTSRMAEIAAENMKRRKWQKDRDDALLQGRLIDLDDKGPQGIDARELSTLAAAATGYHTLGRNALGDDVTRVEITGGDGGAIQVTHGLGSDDQDRLVDVIAAIQRSGIAADLNATGHVVDGEVVADVTEHMHADTPQHDDEAGADPGASSTNDARPLLYDDMSAEALMQQAEDALEEDGYDIAD